MSDDNFALVQLMPRTEEDVLILPGMALFHCGMGKLIVREIRLGIVGPDAPRCHEKELTADGRYWRKVIAVSRPTIAGKELELVNEIGFWGCFATKQAMIGKEESSAEQ